MFIVGHGTLWLWSRLGLREGTFVYVRLSSCRVRALVFMLCTCACVHAACVRLCSCCVRVLVFMLRGVNCRNHQ